MFVFIRILYAVHYFNLFKKFEHTFCRQTYEGGIRPKDSALSLKKTTQFIWNGTKYSRCKYFLFVYLKEQQKNNCILYLRVLDSAGLGNSKDISILHLLTRCLVLARYGHEVLIGSETVITMKLMFERYDLICKQIQSSSTSKYSFKKLLSYIYQTN